MPDATPNPNLELTVQVVRKLSSLNKDWGYRVDLTDARNDYIVAPVNYVLPLVFVWLPLDEEYYFVCASQMKVNSEPPMSLSEITEGLTWIVQLADSLSEALLPNYQRLVDDPAYQTKCLGMGYRPVANWTDVHTLELWTRGSSLFMSVPVLGAQENPDYLYLPIADPSVDFSYATDFWIALKNGIPHLSHKVPITTED